MNFEEIEVFLKRYLTEEDRKDSEFRYAIASNQFGSLGNHMTHDPVLNPRARGYQTKEGEKGDFGHALLQLMVYGISRGLPVGESVELAKKALEDKTWAARKANEGSIQGKIVMPGEVDGTAHVDPFCFNLKSMSAGSILVAEHCDCAITPYLFCKVKAIVTDHGGLTCHAAIIAREMNIPCIVDTGDATKRIENGEYIVIRGNRILQRGKIIEDGENHGN